MPQKITIKRTKKQTIFLRTTSIPHETWPQQDTLKSVSEPQKIQWANDSEI